MLAMILTFFPLVAIIDGVILAVSIRKGENPYRQTSWDKAGRTIVIRSK